MSINDTIQDAINYELMAISALYNVSAASNSQGLQIEEDGQFRALTPAELTAVAKKVTALEQQALADAQKQRLRSDIAQVVGDSDTLLGTTADATQLLLYSVSKILIALEKAELPPATHKEIASLQVMATSFLSKLDKGDIALTFQVKGIEKVIKDIESSATAVTKLIARSKE
ncbi:MAG: hypothetical protein HRU05_02090 [Oceanospirillaceae bacterium]|nr:hypothetical protein [Oceanospirillaceae bacterium]